VCITQDRERYIIIKKKKKTKKKNNKQTNKETNKQQTGKPVFPF
jgi:hypothetical protein